MDDEIDKIIEDIMKDKTVDDNIDIKEVDKLVDEILKDHTIKNNNFFDKVQVKTVEHKMPKRRNCIVQ